MKKIMLSLTLVAFAFVPVLQADDGKAAPALSGCPAQQTTCQAEKASCPVPPAACPADKASCPADKAKCDKGKSCCAELQADACCAPKKPRVAKRTNPSIKGAQLLVMR
jgi:hypothetical protein